MYVLEITSYTLHLLTFINIINVNIDFIIKSSGISQVALFSFKIPSTLYKYQNKK